MPSKEPSPEGAAPSRQADLSDSDQTLSEGDQTGADLDQSSSDIDQYAADHDQLAADRDQRAAELDQAAADLAAGDDGDRGSWADTRRIRSQTTLERDTAAHARHESTRARNATAAQRDAAADARDANAHARDLLAAALDNELAQLQSDDGAARNGQIPLGQGLRDRHNAATARTRAADARRAAANDRAQARADRVRAAADRRHAESELALEGVDHLTRVLRRRAGLAALNRELERSRRTGEPLTLAFIDVDGLKAVNNERGHGAGDALLRGVAQALTHALRPYDVVMRYGGDEFVCALSGQDQVGATKRFAQVSAALAASSDGASISVGFGQADGDERAEQLIARADQAMLAARSARS